ncbi:hypothetical protein SAMN05216382_1918 [Sphingomonas palmae]|uniref:Uncharacterized protein n=1 Tax=Sphingomonas palmae TaxID=1855283 RepID=A0A1H7PRX9_9SPHN|nr:hypothetical protein [Sphingomonas palmae]SEL38015.1 hypothetical protein SAMN05216382_1918 [Sphingomonas palmae]
MRKVLLAAALSTLGCGPAMAQVIASPPESFPNSTTMPPQVAFNLYKTSMLKLRDEARALQQADGGTLTPEHDAEIQRKIDRTTITFHRRVGGLPF